DAGADVEDRGAHAAHHGGDSGRERPARPLLRHTGGLRGVPRGAPGVHEAGGGVRRGREDIGAGGADELRSAVQHRIRAGRAARDMLAMTRPARLQLHAGTRGRIPRAARLLALFRRRVPKVWPVGRRGAWVGARRRRLLARTPRDEPEEQDRNGDSFHGRTLLFASLDEWLAYLRWLTERTYPFAGEWPEAGGCHTCRSKGAGGQ